MLRQAITHVSGLAVFMHLALGFCAHHGHAAAAFQHSAGHVEHFAHSGCSHDHGLPAPDGPALPPHDDCHDTHCSATKALLFVSPDADLSCTWLDLQPAAACLNEADVAAAVSTSYGRGTERSAPPLRAHLRLQVLLI
jgi:hypothetical protein